jgi:NADH-quinone oxidoreductase subunit L
LPVSLARPELSFGLLALPFLSFLILFFFGKKLPRQGDWLGIGTTAGSFLLALFILAQVWNGPPQALNWDWFTLGIGANKISFSVGIYLDALAGLMLALVTFISLLVQVFSVAYMHHEPGYARYYAYLSLFTGAMLGLIFSSNLLVLFIFWELVGFASYLLIGFWFEKSVASQAATKAFLINRLGDVGLLLGLFGLYSLFKTFNLTELNQAFSGQNPTDSAFLTLVGLGLFCGCIGKSAQFPLQIWLPDAMQGPTPVSALIHAATMVAAGVYLLARCFAFFTPDALLVIAIIGTITAVLGGLAALFQNDIKRILAFSTISQLGFMVLGMGTGNPEASLFHLFTHAFFKAALFLISGLIIHAMHHALAELPDHEETDRQDIRNMGGLRKVLPVTFWAYLLAFGGLAGLPFFSGFLSKDAILSGAWAWAEAKGGGLYFAIPDLGFAAVLLTGFYMARQLFYVFFGEFRLNFSPEALRENKFRETSFFLLIPVILLSLLSLAFFFAPNPFNAESGWLYGQGKLFRHLANPPAGNHTIYLLTAIFSTVMALAGIGLAWWQYKKQTLVPAANAVYAEPQNQLARFTFRQFYLNEVYTFLFLKPALFLSKTVAVSDQKVLDKALHFFSKSMVVFSKMIGWFDRVLVDGLVDLIATISAATGSLGRKLQGGEVQQYYLYSILGLGALLLYVLVF